MWWRKEEIPTHRYTYRSVKRRGRLDGRPWKWTVWPFREAKPSKPLTDQDTAPFELELKEAGDKVMSQVAVRWQTEDEDLRRQYCAAFAECLAAKEMFDSETKEAKDAAGVFEERSQDLHRLQFPSMDRRWMYFWLVLIGVGEFVLNAIVFEILGGERWETYLAALAVGVGIPLAGHWVGHALRQDEKVVSDHLLIVTLPIAVFGGLYALALLRAKLFEARGVELAQVLGVKVDPQQFTWIFLLLNVLLFFVALVSGYSGTHRDASAFGKAWTRYRAAARALDKESEEAKGARKRLESARMRMQHDRNRRLKRYQRLRNNAIDAKEWADWFSSAYREANQSARPDQPICFKSDPPSAKIALPSAFKDEELSDWKCPELPQEEREGARQDAPAGTAPESSRKTA